MELVSATELVPTMELLVPTMELVLLSGVLLQPLAQVPRMYGVHGGLRC